MLGVTSQPQSAAKVTDAIPRVTLDQIFTSLCFLAGRERATFDEVRSLLQKETARRSPGSREALWTSARDTLGELQRLALAKTGPLPRKRSDVARLRESPCELTAEGRELASKYEEKSGKGFDLLLIRWVNEHPYFRSYLARLARGPIYVPDITSLKQVGDLDVTQANELGLRIASGCATRLRSVGWSDNGIEIVSREIRERLASDLPRFDLASLRGNAKAWVDFVQDSIVLPSFLAAENLPFDPVTFQHIIRVAQQFLAGAWTSSLSTFDGRVLFATCSFEPRLEDVPLSSESRVHAVLHHGRSWASSRFETSLAIAYSSVSGGRPGTYADVYALRAVVCTELGIQPKVFELCLNDLSRDPQPGRPVLYTELPMRPPPAGEAYVELRGQRIGSVKVVSSAT